MAVVGVELEAGASRLTATRRMPISRPIGAAGASPAIIFFAFSRIVAIGILLR
jgi:hypothetical protein